MANLPPRPDENPYTSAIAGELERPTNVRWRVVAMTVMMSILLYLHRYALSVPQTTIERDLGLDASDMGWVVFAFFWTYALSQVPAGWLSDRFGARRMLAIYVGAWSLALAGMSLANGLWMLIITRGLLGIFQAGAYPTAAGVNKRWMPLARRGVANGSVAMGGRGGAVLSLLATADVMSLAAALLGTVWMIHGSSYVHQTWRTMFAVYAIPGLIWAAVFYWWFRDRPEEHPACNSAEQELIASGSLAARQPADRRRVPIPWLRLFTTRNMVFLCAANILVNAGWIFLVTFLPTYLEKEHSFNIKQSGWLTALPSLAGMVGCLIGGLSTDFLVGRIGLKWGRRLPAVCSGLIVAAAYLLCLKLENPYVIIGVLAVASLLTDLGLGALWAVYQDFGGPHVGAILGFANMCGNLSAAIVSAGIGYLAKDRQWDYVFMMCSASFVLVVICWLNVDPRIPFDPANEESTAS